MKPHQCWRCLRKFDEDEDLRMDVYRCFHGVEAEEGVQAAKRLINVRLAKYHEDHASQMSWIG